MDNKESQSCWEFHNCPEEKRKICSAYIRNMGRECWLVASMFEDSGCFKAKGRGIPFCIKECPWFKKLNPIAKKTKRL